MALFFGSIFIFQAAGVYNLLPERPKAGETIDFGEIKGYMTIKEASIYTNTELKEFYKKFEIPETVPESTMMKAIKEYVPDYEFGYYKALYSMPQ